MQSSRCFVAKQRQNTISHFPDCRIKERGFEVLDGGAAILTLDVKEMRRFDVEQFLQMFPDGAPLEIDGEKCFIGASPERHLSISKGIANLFGTFSS
ncbi:MAG: hypothetical protein GY801_34230 [bacterium]|nr:hypothetical protein [bacterium]